MLMFILVILDGQLETSQLITFSAKLPQTTMVYGLISLLLLLALPDKREHWSHFGQADPFLMLFFYLRSLGDGCTYFIGSIYIYMVIHFFVQMKAFVTDFSYWFLVSEFTWLLSLILSFQIWYPFWYSNWEYEEIWRCLSNIYGIAGRLSGYFCSIWLLKRHLIIKKVLDY